jgi:hypothetical protein
MNTSGLRSKVGAEVGHADLAFLHVGEDQQDSGQMPSAFRRQLNTDLVVFVPDFETARFGDPEAADNGIADDTFVRVHARLLHTNIDEEFYSI